MLSGMYRWTYFFSWGYSPAATNCHSCQKIHGLLRTMPQ